MTKEMTTNEMVIKLTELINSNSYNEVAFSAAMVASYAAIPEGISKESFFFSEDDEDYLKRRAAEHYFGIADKSSEDIRIWLDWRLGKRNEPIVGSDGKYLNVEFDSMSFTIGNRCYNIHGSHVYGSDNDVPIEHLPILNRIVNEIDEIKRLVE